MPNSHHIHSRDKMRHCARPPVCSPASDNRRPHTAASASPAWAPQTGPTALPYMNTPSPQSALRISSALLTVNAPPSSRFRSLTCAPRPINRRLRSSQCQGQGTLLAGKMWNQPAAPEIHFQACMRSGCTCRSPPSSAWAQSADPQAPGVTRLAACLSSGKAVGAEKYHLRLGVSQGHAAQCTQSIAVHGRITPLTHYFYAIPTLPLLVCCTR